MKLLTVRQPWAWLFAHGKDVENRPWCTYYRGPLAIQAALGMTRKEYDHCARFLKHREIPVKLPAFEDLVRGAILGVGELTNCSSYVASRWFFGPLGIQVAHYRALAVPIPFPGARRLKDVPPELAARILEGLAA